jgi:ligand-binding sensor domain-containing protein
MLLKHILTSLHIVVVTVMLAQPVMAQYGENNFTRYTVKDGLSDINITSLQQDNEGYIWIGTDDGLNRFDGAGFKKFYRGSAPLNLLSSGIWNIKKFGNERIGIISKGGLQVLNTKNYTVSSYFIKDSSVISPYLNSAWDAIELPGGRYAVSTTTGFYIYNDKGLVLKRHDAFTAKDIGSKRILYGRDFFKLSASKYALSVNEGRLSLYDDSSKIFKEFVNEDAKDSYLLTNSPFEKVNHWVIKSQIGSDEFIFISTLSPAITWYNHATRKITTSPLAFGITDSVNWQSKIIKLNDSLLAISSGVNGFHLLKKNRLTGEITTDGIKYLRNYKILCLFADKDNRLWVGTTEGLLKQNLQVPVINTWHYGPVEGKKFTGGISTVYRYRDKLYAGRFSHSKGLAIIDPGTMKLIKEIDFFSDKTTWNEVRSIEMYHPDTLWLGTSGGLLWFDTKTEHYGKVLDEQRYVWARGFNPVLSPPKDDGNAWMCGLLGGKVIRYHIPSRVFTLFTPETKPALPFEKVKNIVYDSYGDVWISGHSLARWNSQKQYFDTLITVYGGANKYNDDIVAIQADDNGSLWMHNTYNGLLQYKIREREFVNYTMKDGLPSDGLTALSPVIDNKIWVAASSQLCLFDIGSKKFTIYDNRDGLPEPRPTARKIFYDDQDGMLYLCSNEYLSRFPHTPLKENDNSSPLLIEEVSVNNKKIYFNPEDKIRTDYDQNNLAISFSIIDFDKSNYQFAWRLNKAANWNIIGNQRTINLNNLPPGNYEMEVKASGKPGIEKIKTLSFIIKPPFWKTSWFIIPAALLIGAGIYFIYRRRIRYIHRKAEIDKQLSQTEMKALQAQMNPHFIFNSLNSIREMILNNENKDASHYLSKFAHLIRITLDQSSQSLVSLRDTIDYLERYLEMEQIRNGYLTYKIVADENLDKDEIFIPPMLIQPFIENGLWHGVAANNKTIHIIIYFKKETNCFICTVEDNGIGINKSEKNKNDNAIKRKSHGISNINQRIRLLNEKHGLHCKVNIRDKQDVPGSNSTGTLVTIYLPLEISESE